jgi:hypothetical protein
LCCAVSVPYPSSCPGTGSTPCSLRLRQPPGPRPARHRRLTAGRADPRRLRRTHLRHHLADRRARPGRSSGPQPRRQPLTRVANTAPEQLARIVYLSAYCCVASPIVLAYAPTAPAPDSPLGRARRISFLGQPGRTWVSRINPRTADPDVLAVQHALLMADLNPAQVPAVLAYATQPDEPLQVVVTDARLTPRCGDGCRAPSQPATMPRSHNPQRSPTSLPPRVPPSRGLRHDQKLKRPRAAAVR